MSALGDSRQEIADQLSTIADVNGNLYKTKAMNTGDAWPLIDFMDRGPGTDFMVTWKVMIVLPRDEHSAMMWFEDHYIDVTAALEEIGFVESIEPFAMLTEAGTREVMTVTLNKEA